MEKNHQRPASRFAVAMAEALRVVVIGDSNIEGKGVSTGDAYPAQLERALRAKGFDVSVTNAGRNGDTTFGVLARLDSSVPDGTALAIVSVGINDIILHHQSPEETRGRVQQIVQRLRARGINTILLPTGKKFQGSIAENPSYHVEGGTGPAPGTTEWHLNPQGYAVIVANTLPQVIAALGKAKRGK